MKSLAEELSSGLAGASMASARGSWSGRQVIQAGERLAAWLDQVPPAPLISSLADAVSTAITVLAGDLVGRPVVHLDPDSQAPPLGGIVVSESPIEPAGYQDEAFGLYGGVTSATGGPSALPERSHLFFTSGSTGVPTGVVRSAAAVIADARRVISILRYTTERNILVGAPVYHVYGFNYGLIAPLLSASAIYYSGPRHIPSQLERAIMKHHADTLIGHPALYRMLADDNRAAAQAQPLGLKRAVSAGAPLPPGSASAFIRRYHADLFNCYGSSEAGAVTLSQVTGDEAAGEAGILLDGIDARIVEDELQLRSDSLACGYLSAAGLIPLKLTGDWYRTGDLADLADRAIRLRGRVADIINVAGKKVTPAEIETVLLAHPEVADVEVFAEPDPVRGSVPVALVALSQDVPVTELVGWCRARLDSYKVPRRIEVSREIARTVTGKRLRAAGCESRADA